MGRRGPYDGGVERNRPVLEADDSSTSSSSRMVGGAQAQFPGHRFRPTGAIDAHHDWARWGWELVGPDGGATVAAGVDVAVLAPDGRLRAVTVFFHQPAGAAK